jgi:DnaJ-domain-containing protein 1
VFALTDLAGERDVSRWLEGRRREVAGLLAETAPDRLSDQQVEEVFRLRRSFETTDAVVIDWDAALVVDLDGYAEDVLFVLELANLQLEEFRWMDRVLDRYLDQACEDLVRRRW